MLHLLTAKQMRELDSRAIHEFGLPARLLMEIAGKGCADFLIRGFPQRLAQGVCVLCGSGNNGGDGAVIARWLRLNGFGVNILRVGKGSLSPETKANLELCDALGIPSAVIRKPQDLPLAEELIRASGILIDAAFGTGFHGEPEPLLRDLFHSINQDAPFVVAVDIPSGLDADTGFFSGAIFADLTLAIESYKLGHVTGQGKLVCGRLHLVPLGIPPGYYGTLDTARLFTAEDFRPPNRLPVWHKNDLGKVYIFGGIAGFTGASVMAALAALRAGCGYVFVLHRPELRDLYAQKLTEALYLPVPEQKGDRVPEAKALLAALADASAVLIGPGLGRDRYALKLLQIVLKGVKAPLVVDADALNLISGQPELLNLISRSNILLTPHWGEFARLAGIDKESLRQDCLGNLRNFVAGHGARVLLKSHFSVYQDSARTWVNTSGNDGLATGGSGDVLAGIIASFLAQGKDIPDAAISASYLLGKTAEDLAAGRAAASILPTDVIDALYMYPQAEEQ